MSYDCRKGTANYRLEDGKHAVQIAVGFQAYGNNI